MRTKLRALIRSILWKGALRRYVGENPYVIAVVGSVGKTSTKEAVYEVLLRSGAPVRKTLGNLATDIGVPLSLLGIPAIPASVWGWLRVVCIAAFARPQYTGPLRPYYILEYSTDSVGDTDFLASRIPPHVVVVTAITPVHMEQYGDEVTMRNETLSILSHLAEDGLVVASASDAFQREALAGDLRVRWYGLANDVSSGLSIKEQRFADNKITAYVTVTAESGSAPKRGFTVAVSVFAPHQLLPLAAAAAVGNAVGMPGSAIREGMAAYTLPAGRGRIIEGMREVTIIDDSANSSPAAVVAGLRVLSRIAGGNRRSVAILGTMNELGEYAEAAHREIAREAALSCSLFVAVGRYAKIMVEEAHASGMPQGAVMQFAHPEDLIERLNQVVRRGDVVLVKASQSGMYLERVVFALMKHPERAHELLFRQEKFWKKKHRHRR